jgi:hypothetical protein
VSEPPHDDSPRAAQGAPAPRSGDTEELDAVIVGGEAELEPYRSGSLPVRALIAPTQVALAAAVAATGFVAGATVVSLAHRRGQRALGRGGRSRRRTGGREIAQIVASRSLLVDVHLLGSPGRNS